jgi:hypothetical protein
MPKAYLRGLTQREEKQQGVDFFAQLTPAARIFAFQFKAPRGGNEGAPYRYTLVDEQHALLHALATIAPYGVYYVLPFYVTHIKLEQNVPNLVQDTWLLPVQPMVPSQIFHGQRTKTIRCSAGTAWVNPEYQIQPMAKQRINQAGGIPSKEFAPWYSRLRETEAIRERRWRSPWLVRGLRVAIVESEPPTV